MGHLGLASILFQPLVLPLLDLSASPIQFGHQSYSLVMVLRATAILSASFSSFVHEELHKSDIQLLNKSIKVTLQAVLAVYCWLTCVLLPFHRNSRG